MFERFKLIGNQVALVRQWAVFCLMWGIIGLSAGRDPFGLVPLGKWIGLLDGTTDVTLRGFYDRVVPWCLLILTATSTAGCGGRILQAVAGRQRRPFEFLVLASALGWAVLGVALCAIAAAGQFRIPVLAVSSFMVSSIFGWGLDGRLSGCQVWRALPWKLVIRAYSQQVAAQIAGILTVLVVLLTLLWAAGPVWDYDSEMYHLPNSLNFLRHEGLFTSRSDALANLPGQAYLWFALGLAAQAEAYPALLVCWATVLTSILAASLGARWLGWRVAIWTAPVYWSGLIVQAVAATPRIEPLYSLMFLASVSWLLEAWRHINLNWNHVCCTGICLGTAASIKSQGLYCWPVIACWLGTSWLLGSRPRTWNQLWRTGCVFLIAFGVLSPWWIKNYREFGNPLHPMLSRIVNRDDLRNANPYGPTNQTRPWYFWARDTVDLFVRPNTFSGPPGQWPHYMFLTLPLLVFVIPRRRNGRGGSKTLEKSVGDGEEALRAIEHFNGPEPFASDGDCEVRACTSRDGGTRTAIFILIGLAASYYLIALTLTHELRHQFGMFPLASLLVAYVIVQFQLRWRMDFLLPVLVSLNLLLVVIFPARSARVISLLKYHAGQLDGRRFREGIVKENYSSVCDWCNQNLPHDAVILLCWEGRRYRLLHDAIIDPGACTWRTLFHHRFHPDEISAYLHQQGVNYVLVNESAMLYNLNRSKLISHGIYEEFCQQREMLVPGVLELMYEFSPKKSQNVLVYRVR